MKIALARSLVFAALGLGAIVIGGASASAQGLPPGSYQQSCGRIHWEGGALIAECRTRDGQMARTVLPDVRRCVGDIANLDGQLQCRYAGGPPQPPAPGYAPPGYGGYDQGRGRCEELWHRERELRERLQSEPWGPDRERLEYRLRETHEDRERLGCGR